MEIAALIASLRVPPAMLGERPSPRSAIERGLAELSYAEPFERRYGVCLGRSDEALYVERLRMMQQLGIVGGG